MSHDVCRVCNSSEYLFDDHVNGQIVCTNCGLVLDMNCISDTPISDDYSRCDLMSSFSTINDVVKCDENTNIKHSMDKLQKRHLFFDNIIMINEDQIHTNVLNHACDIFLKFNSKKITRGQVRLGIIACSIQQACVELDMHRTISEISKMLGIKREIVNKANKVFKTYSCNLSIACDSSVGDFYKINNRFCNLLSLPSHTTANLKRCTLKMYHTLINKNIDTFNHTLNAISSTLIVYSLDKMKINLNKKHVSSVHNVSIVTINKLLRFLDKEFSTHENE